MSRDADQPAGLKGRLGEITARLLTSAGEFGYLPMMRAR